MSGYIQYGIRCHLCGDEIYSNTRHDYEECLCGHTSIDGGWDYSKWSGSPEPEVVSRSVDRRKLPFYYSDEPARKALLIAKGNHQSLAGETGVSVAPTASGGHP